QPATPSGGRHPARRLPAEFQNRVNIGLTYFPKSEESASSRYSVFGDGENEGGAYVEACPHRSGGFLSGRALRTHTPCPVPGHHRRHRGGRRGPERGGAA